MSKFFDETQKAQRWTPAATGPVRLDVVSVIDAIKHSETAVANPTDPAPGANDGQVQPDAGTSRLITRITKSSAVTDAAVEAYRTLRTRVLRLQASKEMRSIILTSAVPSEGKTVTSLNLALSCAQLHDRRILLADGDLRSRGLTRLLEISASPGLSDVLAKGCLADQAVLSTEDANLFVVGAGLSCSQPAELFASSSWPEFIKWANTNFEITIVDAPPIHPLTDAELISAGCDGVLVVVRAFSTPREIAQKCIRRLDKKKLIGAVFNGLPTVPYGYSYYGVPNGNSDRNSTSNGSR